MDFTRKETLALLEFFGDEDLDNPEMTITVKEVGKDEKAHSGPGLYAYYSEYPEAGARCLSG